MTRSLRALCVALLFAVASLVSLPAHAAFPDRPITLIVPWAAGGGTDQVARKIAQLLEADFKVPVNVVNRIGGNGVIGHTALATAPADGYTFGMITIEINMMHWMKLTEVNHQSYVPLALMNADPAGIQIRANAPYKSVPELIEAIRANPGKLKASGTGVGGGWHLALAGMLRSFNIDPKTVPWVPATGAAAALLDLAAGGLDIVPSSIPEATALVSAGRVRSLAVMSEKRNPAIPDVPTLKEAAGSDWTMALWRGMVGPKGMPAEAVTKYREALKRVYEHKDFQDFMAARGFTPVWADGDGFAAFMAKDNREIGEVMTALGLRS
ncbi:tripartite tricarboxylate transporter family receptor [Variibacter gotjawalensis]|uniref:Tripartite tricarboxylate transporter family receptor n=1 Tax=Variibacter gotjawalensis TaxID=1333996 RepID=A0A0S3PW57_9BRAD|nr:tripartite tricarboxylate transporter substrate binding protein [Variibacter gotjawalensis]NIK45976.1 tripartite-type tricarboxylate transporter receptor subunit TctC [Variibacter gotjawalensis]RZS47894.1 tripartite-type tricarboxylate transporter receptor subunit TctC [Variibacter gotjawalensis]BAT60150.1 tripartite tricarboxylate transporter family receptor [Variibacter gotjawalensis]